MTTARYSLDTEHFQTTCGPYLVVCFLRSGILPRYLKTWQKQNQNARALTDIHTRLFSENCYTTSLLYKLPVMCWIKDKKQLVICPRAVDMCYEFSITQIGYEKFSVHMTVVENTCNCANIKSNLMHKVRNLYAALIYM